MDEAGPCELIIPMKNGDEVTEEPVDCPFDSVNYHCEWEEVK